MSVLQKIADIEAEIARTQVGKIPTKRTLLCLSQVTITHNLPVSFMQKNKATSGHLGLLKVNHFYNPHRFPSNLLNTPQYAAAPCWLPSHQLLHPPLLL